MTQTAADRLIGSRELANRLFNATQIANLNIDDLVAAVGAIDDKMDVLPATLNQLQSVKINLIQALPEPFKSNSTAPQKALALMVWAMKESGII